MAEACDLDRSWRACEKLARSVAIADRPRADADRVVRHLEERVEGDDLVHLATTDVHMVGERIRQLGRDRADLPPDMPEVVEQLRPLARQLGDQHGRREHVHEAIVLPVRVSTIRVRRDRARNTVASVAVVRLAVAPLALVIVVVLLPGCGGDEESSSDVSTLEGVPWVLAGGIDVEGWEKAAPSATFEDGKVTGSTGCNRYGGQYAVDGDALEISAVASTLMACPPPADEVERALLTAFEKVSGWRVEDAELVLLDAEGEEVLHYQAATLIGSWVGTGILQGDALTSPIAGTEITASFTDEDELSGSAGCNTYIATYTTDSGAIEITAPASTRKACAEPEGVMEQEAAYLQVLPTAVSYRLDAGSLQLLSADRTAVASYTRAP